MKRIVSLTANIAGSDLGAVADEVTQAIKRAGDVPKGVAVDIRGQITPLRELLQDLLLGSASRWQSLRCAHGVLSISSIGTRCCRADSCRPCGVVLSLLITGSTLTCNHLLARSWRLGWRRRTRS